jgi:hypothetical protein
VINRRRDSLELSREFIDAVPKAAVHVVCNGYFGDEKRFELYNGSKIREEVEGRGGESITLPDLADRLADDIYSRRVSLSWCAGASQSMPPDAQKALVTSRFGVATIRTCECGYLRAVYYLEASVRSYRPAPGGEPLAQECAP